MISQWFRPESGWLQRRLQGRAQTKSVREHEVSNGSRPSERLLPLAKTLDHVMKTRRVFKKRTINPHVRYNTETRPWSPWVIFNPRSNLLLERVQDEYVFLAVQTLHVRAFDSRTIHGVRFDRFAPPIDYRSGFACQSTPRNIGETRRRKP